MAGYIYLPVPTGEMLEFAKDWQEGQKEKGRPAYDILQNYESGWRKGFVRGIGRGVLRNVNNTDKLYILAHGKALGSKQIGAERGGHRIMTRGVPGWDGGTYKTYTAVQLAKVMEAEGLRKTFIDLRVFACGSALAPAGEAPTVSFAQGLKDALRGAGYNAIAVTGYLGSVRSAYAHRQIRGNWDLTEKKYKGVELASGEIVPSHTQRIVF